MDPGLRGGGERRNRMGRMVGSGGSSSRGEGGGCSSRGGIRRGRVMEGIKRMRERLKEREGGRKGIERPYR